MSKYKLIYFNAMGRAEATRLIFAQAAVEYEDYRVQSQEEWLILKPNTPMAQLPVLGVDGVQLCQAQAINQYLGRTFGMAGSNELEAARCDMLVAGLEELINYFKPWYAENDPNKKKELWNELNDQHLQPFLQRYEKFLENNASGYFVGEKISWADIVLHSMFSFWGEKMPGLFDNHKRIQEFTTKIGELPNIKNWIETHPKTLW